MRRYLAWLVDLLLPQVCVVCGRRCIGGATGLACAVCWSRVAWLGEPQCQRCGYPGPGRDCAWCRLLPPYVRAARSLAWVPGGVSGVLLHALKYSGWWRVAEGIALRMARLTWPDDVVTERSAIVPVPLAAERLAQRGYNQSEYLARFLARYWQIPVWSGVVRRRVATRSQARLTAAARLGNVAGAFEVVVPATLLEGKHLILLDDVITTGATMNSCAAELFAAGARTLSYITFGRARLPGDAP